MPQEKMFVERRTIRSSLEEIVTYLSLLSFFSPFLGGFIFWQGFIERNIALLSAVLPLIMGISWLVSQYRRAKDRMIKEGIVQRPAWLWKFITNKVPHKSEELLDSQVMVFVPPDKEEYAGQLDAEYNSDGRNLLLFHYIPKPAEGVIDEDQGRVSHGGEVRSLETLAQEMNECAALILLDDTNWEKYGRTIKLVEDWTKRHTVRPVMSVRLGGRGTLNFSWNRIQDLLTPNRSLKNKLLTQAANRGARWFWQARLYRRIVIWTFAIALIFSSTSFFLSYIWQRKARTASEEAQGKAVKLGNDVNILNKIVYSPPSAEQDISRALQKFRSDMRMPEADRLRQLLQVHAYQIRATLAGASGQPEAISGNVIMFWVKKTDRNKWNIGEVVATRIPPNDQDFQVELQEKKVTEVHGLVGCAVVSRAFILWSGEWKGKDVTTTDIEAWDLAGNKIGERAGEKILIENNLCDYQKRPKEDLHRRILCAPVGLDLNSNEINPAGAICVEYTTPLDFLGESWVRQTISRYGSSLSFESWDKALPPRNNGVARRARRRNDGPPRGVRPGAVYRWADPGR